MARLALRPATRVAARPIKNNFNNLNATTAISYRRQLSNKTMNRDFVFPLVAGIIVGALVMILWQFNSRLNNVALGVNQLSQVTNQNAQTVNDIVNFINSAGGQQAAPTPTLE